MLSQDTPILIVDDMSDMREFIAMACMELGFRNFAEAPDGALAWEMISEAWTPFGLVISDWNMPNCTGIELLKKVRSDERFQDLPFLLVTSESAEHKMEEARRSRVSGYVVKPFSLDDLRNELDEAFRKIQK